MQLIISSNVWVHKGPIGPPHPHPYSLLIYTLAPPLQHVKQTPRPTPFITPSRASLATTSETATSPMQRGARPPHPNTHFSNEFSHFLRVLWCCPGAVWGSPFGASWDPLGLPWGRLAASWAILGASWLVLKASYSPLGPSGGRLGGIFGVFGAVLPPLGPSWAPLGPSSRPPRRLLDHPGGILGRLRCLWGCLGASWALPITGHGSFDAIPHNAWGAQGGLGDIWAASWPFSKPLGRLLGHGASWALPNWL